MVDLYRSYPDSTNFIERSSHFPFRMTKRLWGSTVTTRSSTETRLPPIFTLLRNLTSRVRLVWISGRLIYSRGTSMMSSVRCTLRNSAQPLIQLPGPLFDQHQSQQSGLEALSQSDEEEVNRTDSTPKTFKMGTFIPDIPAIIRKAKKQAAENKIRNT
jgi:hypothetical protein